MKNKAILKSKCMERSLYTPNIFHLGQEVMFTKDFYFLKPTKKYFIISYLIKKAQYKIKNIYTCNTAD